MICTSAILSASLRKVNEELLLLDKTKLLAPRYTGDKIKKLEKIRAELEQKIIYALANEINI